MVRNPVSNGTAATAYTDKTGLQPSNRSERRIRDKKNKELDLHFWEGAWYDDKGRMRDINTGGCINKPKGPQGNTPQHHVRGGQQLANGDIFQEINEKGGKEALKYIQSEVESLRKKFQSDKHWLHLSELQSGTRPWLYLVMVYGDNVLIMHIHIRNMIAYRNGQHCLECSFTEGPQNSEIKQTLQAFRTISLSKLLEYFVKEYRRRTTGTPDVEDDLVLVDRTGQRILSNVALNILRPQTSEPDGPDLRSLTVCVPGGTSAFRGVVSDGVHQAVAQLLSQGMSGEAPIDLSDESIGSDEHIDNNESGQSTPIMTPMEISDEDAEGEPDPDYSATPAIADTVQDMVDDSDDEEALMKEMAENVESEPDDEDDDDEDNEDNNDWELEIIENP